MRRNTKDQPRNNNPVVSDLNESPAILNLIEQLDRDLKESEGKSPKAH
jgi:hypothetical protein